MSKFRVKSGRVMVYSPHGRVFYDEGQIFEAKVGDIFPLYRDLVEEVHEDGNTSEIPEDAPFTVEIDKDTLEYEGGEDEEEPTVLKKKSKKRKTKKRRKVID